MSFESTKSQFVQTHFSIIEIDAPVVNLGFGTPISADGAASTGTQTYKFTDYAGLIPESDIWKCVSKVSETTTKLKPGKGLAMRGSGSIQLYDFKGDPNPFAPDVTTAMRKEYGYLAKLDVRNVLTNRDCRIKNYRVNTDGTIDLTASETRYYIVDSFISNGKGKWTLKLKDELSRVNIDETVWPLETNGYLRENLDTAFTTLNLDPNTTYVTNDVVRIGEELMRITAVSNIGTGSAQATVQSRGTPITYTNLLSNTKALSHSAGDQVIVCEVSDDERIDDLLERILLDIGISADRIPKSDWTAEVDEWLSGVRVNTIWVESLSTDEILEKILTFFMLDMWFDPVAREIKLSAINVWKESTGTVTEGNEIDFETVKRMPNENLRATRALVVYDKGFLASSESIENYDKGSLFVRPELEGSDFYGEAKVKQFGFNYVIGTDGADLLVNRYVNRFISPINYSWKTQERKLNFNVGDIRNIQTNADVNFDGSPSDTSRVQILSIQPKYTQFGREYAVEGLSMEPVFLDDSEIVIAGNISNVNLYTQYAGAPSQAVTITFIFDATISSSNSTSIPSIKAGAFPSGSVINIIMVNGADLMAKGGDGGRGGGAFYEFEQSMFFDVPQGDGADGGTVYDAEGVDTNIYFSGATPSAAYPVADGFIRAPSGGDGGFSAITFTTPTIGGTAGNGGNGGDGRVGGIGGNNAEIEVGGVIVDESEFGSTGDEDGFTGSFGQDGVDNDAVKGLKGKGVIDSGATVTFFGSNATRYINGSGDH